MSLLEETTTDANSEANGRSTLFLNAVSSAIVALASRLPLAWKIAVGGITFLFSVITLQRYQMDQWRRAEKQL